MSMLNIRASYFALANPLHALEQRLRRYPHRHCITLDNGDVELRWSRGAEAELQRRESTLVVEMQLYFSCVVKKRVLFHDHADFASVAVNDKLRLAFQPVASAVCDPREFAENYPAGKSFTDSAAARMLPRAVELHFGREGWQGQFFY